MAGAAAGGGMLLSRKGFPIIYHSLEQVLKTLTNSEVRNNEAFRDMV